jgi:rhodanese-related sulfurtransferase
MKRLVLIIGFWMAMFSTAMAADTMSVEDAWSKMQNGSLVLIDVRTKGEWQESGIAPGAITLTMGVENYYEKLEKIVAENPGKTIGLICAAGGRSTQTAAELEKRGLSQVVDVKQGMGGGIFSAGWIGAGLPVVPYKQMN